MALTLDTLARDCRAALLHADARTGREQVAALLAAALRDRAFLDTLFAGGTPERKIVHQDPELGFCLLVHEYHDARSGGPHDHGTSWAIYGQAEGETVMTDFECLTPSTAQGPGTVRPLRSYPMRPGDVHVYHEGAIHAPSRTGFCRLVRVEGCNLETVARGKYRVAEESPAT